MEILMRKRTERRRHMKAYLREICQRRRGKLHCCLGQCEKMRIQGGEAGGMNEAIQNATEPPLKLETKISQEAGLLGFEYF